MADFVGHLCFESWGLLARALEQFNEAQKKTESATNLFRSLS